MALDINEIITDLPNLFNLSDHRVANINVKPLTENVTVGNKPISFEIDTGAGCYSLKLRLEQDTGCYSIL